MRSMSRFALNRRTLLRGSAYGVGAALALPTLEAMLNSSGTALADGTAIPKRFMTWFFGNGVRLARWVPAAQGPNYELSEELAPLANVREYCSVLSGFQNRCPVQITHHEGMGVFNGYLMTEIEGLFSKAGGPTIDQVIADKLAGTTTFDSVQVGISKKLSVMDSGTTMFYLSHRGPDQPLPAERDPKALWTRLFGSFTPQDDPSGPLRVSVLDAVRDNTAALRKRLGKKDNERLDAHLEAVSALEKKIEALPPVCMRPDQPQVDNELVNGVEPLQLVSDTMHDLLVYAFSCDITRVASLMWMGGACETIFADLGQVSGHHDNTHNDQAQEQVHQAVVYTMQRFAYFLEKLKATPDGANGNLLDNTLILMSSDCSEGLTHDIFDQPIVVAGKGGGSVVHPGIHYRSASGENPTDILVSCLRAFAPESTEAVGGAEMASSTPCAALAP